MLAGYTLGQEVEWKTMFQNFWDKFRSAMGEYHPVFEDHAERLEVCLPIFIHGDEGRGKLRRAVLATSVQPVLVSEGHAGHRFNSRFLHSVMPGEHYEGDSTVQILQEALVEDLQGLYTHGCEALGFQFEPRFPVTIFGKHVHACMHACMHSLCGSHPIPNYSFQQGKSLCMSLCKVRDLLRLQLKMDGNCVSTLCW